jgi:serine protease
MVTLTITGTSAVAAPAAPDRPPGHVQTSAGPPRALGILATASKPVSSDVLSRVERLVGRRAVAQVRLGGSDIAIRFDRPTPPAAVARLTAKLNALPEISAVSPDLEVTTDSLPTDPYFPDQINLSAPTTSAAPVYSIDAPRLWQATTGSRKVVVAVLDSGIVSHPDLSGATVPGYDMVSDPVRARDGNGRDSNPADPGTWSTGTYCAASSSSWHGTHVAGIIGARHNSIGVAGVAPGVAIQPVRVVGQCGGAMSDIVAAIRWASGGHVTGVPDNATPADVLNLSLSSTVSDHSCPDAYQTVIDEARSRGAVVVVSAGNQAITVSNRTPSNCAGVLSVGATTPDGAPTTYTNGGRTLGMVAPGGVDPRVAPDPGIWSTLNSGTKGPGSSTYGQLSGTSMAAPQVSGAAALIFSLGHVTADEVIATLKRSAVKPPRLDGFYTCISTDESTGEERNVCGAGILNLAAIPAPTSAPTISGSSSIGSVLTAAPGSWNVQPDDVMFQWLRNGVPIEGATSEQHTISTADLGRSVVVRTTGHADGYPDFSRDSAARAVAAARSTVTLVLSTTSAVRSRTVVKATAVVSAAYAQSTSGTVSFYVGTAKVGTASVSNGVAILKLPVFKKTGSYTVTARYSGNSTVAASTSSKITVRVR